MSQEIIKALQSVTCKDIIPEVLTYGHTIYDQYRKVFNLRFNLKPAYIFLPECEEQIANAVKVANKFNLLLRVRGGGHDHEGESSATGALVIDCRKMKRWRIVERAGYEDKVLVSLQPGLRFMDFVQNMSQYDGDKPAPGRIVPRGTCESVGVAGFSMGGGWGPWTRKHGMCCEYLVEARIVLGDGQIYTVNKDQRPELLWALKGGGGFGYGIVTEFIFETLEAPKNAIKFNMVWEHTPALRVLERWEQLTNPEFSDPSICTGGNPKLVGTNLKIIAIPAVGSAATQAIHKCVFYGYYWGEKPTYDKMVIELKDDLKKWFSGGLYEEASINIPDKKENNDKISFSSWERLPVKIPVTGPKQGEEMNLKMDFEPDHDKPAPHKLTCRLAKSITNGWGAEGRKTLIRSLQSPLISKEGKEMGIHTYVTLGAIWGNYYNNPNHQNQPFPAGNAFPYKDRPYTIQYQCWWNVNEIKEGMVGMAYTGEVDLYVNKALDWIEENRQRYFPETLGSFISFKDSSVPTSQYFLQNYAKLQEIKEKYSQDKFNRFHSRKTII